MRRLNQIVTIVLGVAALLAWVKFVHIHYIDGWGGRSVDLGSAAALSAMACVGWVLVTRARAKGDGETHCRKCKYILKGISEPRCPECGERI